MALDKHDSEILTSLHGRRLGLDNGGYVVGTPGTRLPIESSTATSTLADSGVSYLSGSTASHTLPSPASAGVVKVIVNASSVSTATMTITRDSSDHGIWGSTGGDPIGAALSLINAGSAVTLVSIPSTVAAGNIWALATSPPSTLWQSISTSS